MAYKDELQENNDALRAILQQVNELPDQASADGVKIHRLLSADGSEAMGAYDLSVDLTEYDAVSIYYRNKTNSTVYLSTGLIPVGGAFTLFYITSDGASQRRGGAVYTDRISFENGYAGTAASTAVCIPCAIYAYKGIT